MNNRIKDTFDQIHAEDELKAKTKEFLAYKSQRHVNHKAVKYQRLISAMACLLVVLIGCGGYWIYVTPTAAISIDINPSVELGINRFDKVVSVDGYSDDGQELAASLHIKYMDYAEAVEQMLGSESITELLSQDEILTIAVVGTDEEQCGRILTQMESSTAGQKNAYCYSANPEEVAAAHEAGLSYGKYRAFLEVQALDPNITTEEIQGMTMREIRDLIDELSDSSGYEEQENENQHSGNGQGHGNGYGKEQGNGKSKNR